MCWIQYVNYLFPQTLLILDLLYYYNGCRGDKWSIGITDLSLFNALMFLNLLIKYKICGKSNGSLLVDSLLKKGEEENENELVKPVFNDPFDFHPQSIAPLESKLTASIFFLTQKV